MNKIVVVKFGGSSVTELGLEKLVRKLEKYRGNRKVVCVLSAESKQTEQYLNQIDGLNSSPPSREKDSLLSIGEHYSIVRAALASTGIGVKAASLLGWQIGIRTTCSNAGRAYIESIDVTKIKAMFKEYDTLFVAGFQGVDNNGDITTLGRGGSDITAVALASALKLSECLIVSDTDGLYRVDPRVIGNNGKLIGNINYEDALELSSLGAKIIQPRAVEMAKNHNVKIRFAYYNTFDAETPVTLISNKHSPDLISGIALSKSESLVEINGIDNIPGTASGILTHLFSKGLDIDMVTHSEAINGNSQLIFTVDMLDINLEVLKSALIESLQLSDNKNAKIDHISDDISKVSLVGKGIQSSTYFVGEVQEVLGNCNIVYRLIGGPRNRVSIVVNRDDGERCVEELNSHFFKEN